ncbi:MAG: PIN domain-containing protein [Pseudomonadota bacterium]
MRVFLDSNIVLYALGDDESKSGRANALLATRPHISIQVINECSHVLRRKLLWPPAKVAEELSVVIGLVRLENISIVQIRSAWVLAGRYGFGHYDSLIIASALAAGCATLYTEDMQHGQVIEGQMTLVNPFLATAMPHE